MIGYISLLFLEYIKNKNQFTTYNFLNIHILWLDIIISRNQWGEVSLLYIRWFGFCFWGYNHIIFYNMEEIMMVNSNTTKKCDIYIEIYYFYLQCWVDKVQVVIDNIKYSFIHSDIYTKDIGKFSTANTP